MNHYCCKSWLFIITHSNSLWSLSQLNSLIVWCWWILHMHTHGIHGCSILIQRHSQLGIKVLIWHAFILLHFVVVHYNLFQFPLILVVLNSLIFPCAHRCRTHWVADSWGQIQILHIMVFSLCASDNNYIIRCTSLLNLLFMMTEIGIVNRKDRMPSSTVDLSRCEFIWNCYQDCLCLSVWSNIVTWNIFFLVFLSFIIVFLSLLTVCLRWPKNAWVYQNFQYSMRRIMYFSLKKLEDWTVVLILTSYP